jgi:hypothetical protein
VSVAESMGALGISQCCEINGNSDGNYWKSGKFALVVILLRMAKKLSQMMRHALVLSTGICQTPLLMSLDLGWIPLGECALLLLEKCVLVIPPSESNEICLKTIALVYWEMRRKGFPESGLMLALEPQLYPQKVSHVQVWKMCPS